MSGTPFFSVIIPTFNRAHLLGKAIQSVLDQTFTDWELIVVDDGSTDKTAEVVRSFGDGRIRYYYQENSGKSSARNRGIDLSKGLYISFLDDDDYLLESFLDTFEKSIKKNHYPVGFFMCNESVKTSNNKIIPELVPAGLIDKPVYLLWKIQSSIRPFTIHRQVFDTLRFKTNCLFGQDFHLIIRISLNFPIYYLPFTGCVNVRHRETGTRKKFITNLSQNAHSSIDCLDDLLEKNPELFNLIPEKMIYAQRNHIIYGFSSASMKNGDFALFFELIRKFKFKGNLHKTCYLWISLCSRFPYYAILQLLYK